MGSRTEAAVVMVQRAHRDIVFEVVPFFEDVCIVTPEGRLPFLVGTDTPEEVMENILRHLYQLDVRLPFEGIEDVGDVAEEGRLASRLANRHNFKNALHGLIACRKYGLHQLSDRYQRTVLSCIFFAQHYRDLIFMVEIAFNLHRTVARGLGINGRLRYIALINLVFELDNVLEQLPWRGLPGLQRKAAECANICARHSLQRGALGPEVDSREMRQFLMFCADILDYEVTANEVDDIITFEMTRRAFEATHQYRR
ncbi:uncharacterized protein MYCFIDRAFT_76979 [Pseudocercospora fijiensis CIRAD86]|uniref:BTB domain-containing protein n=1 Tax=Pseudocercospora fijiensis (strain CIRAD86) TaxID=383855 RepID=M3AV54_PSEFD|nr:uncharacterized protein MYCFIDRAFT_76979 [Pseudocercospora fijiensis CIRAD86]EME81043.1 hypothetical protein MYCFIDRAFT_76979 [Pseudocercospora fijiensis CIRAD86]